MSEEVPSHGLDEAFLLGILALQLCILLVVCIADFLWHRLQNR